MQWTDPLGVPISQAIRVYNTKFPLAASCNALHYELHQLRHRPSTPLYSHFPSIITIDVGSIPVTMMISPPGVRGQEEDDDVHLRLDNQDADDLSSDSDDDDDDDWNDSSQYNGNYEPRTVKIRVEPWQTLLLLDDRSSKSADQIWTEMVGLGIDTEGQANNSISPALAPLQNVPTAYGARRDSVAGTVGTAATIETEGALMRALIDACDVSKPCALKRCDWPVADIQSCRHCSSAPI